MTRRPRHAIPAALTLAFAFAAVTCGYPDFEYRDGGAASGGGNASDVRVPCGGGNTCERGESCCGYNGFDPSCKNGCIDPKTAACGMNQTNCAPGDYAVFSCNGPSDCPGQTCCLLINSEDLVQSISCTATCSAAGTGVVCTNDADCPPNAPSCKPIFKNFPGYDVCSPQ